MSWNSTKQLQTPLVYLCSLQHDTGKVAHVQNSDPPSLIIMLMLMMSSDVHVDVDVHVHVRIADV